MRGCENYSPLCTGLTVVCTTPPGWEGGGGGGRGEWDSNVKMTANKSYFIEGIVCSLVPLRERKYKMTTVRIIAVRGKFI